MVFSEIYGDYYRTLSAILAAAAEGPVTGPQLTRLVRDTAFAESSLSIPAALTSGRWPLLDRQGRSVLRRAPAMPLTTLEKQWLKAVLADPRMALFAPDTAGLEDVEPLFGPETFVYYDRYADGDPYTDPGYIQCFRTVTEAMRQGCRLRVLYRGRNGRDRWLPCTPRRLEYSEKDDKFRLLCGGSGPQHTLNLGRMQACRLVRAAPAKNDPPERAQQQLTLLLRDQRNALERVLLHFSHLEKETRQLDDGRYQIILRYDRGDRRELLIRILSFGPLVQVTDPPEFVDCIRRRLLRQRALGDLSGGGEDMNKP